MLSKVNYTALLANVNPGAPRDIDTVLFDAPDLAETLDIAPKGATFSPRLWPFADPNVSFIGCRVKTPIEHPEHLAARLAAIALERQVHPVFLSYIEDCGMQRFGFRVEQLSGLIQDAQEDFEAQLEQFWQFALTLDAADLNLLR